MRTEADNAAVVLDAYHGTSPDAPLVGGQDIVSNKRLSVLWAGNTRGMAEQFQDGEIRRLRLKLARPLVLSSERRAELFGNDSHARIAQKVLEARLSGAEDYDGVIFEDTVDGMEVGDVYAIFPIDGSVDHAVEVVGLLRYDADTGDESATPEFYDAAPAAACRPRM